ncbi:MAG: type I DNA topoisomerase, partial [Deferribacteraceae bacterium]|nr:type I DNA topoisomerase [Deferribacteraceae bacterium]
MSKSLVIVESPAKAKTIENYLGKGYEVLASVGHIIDLPEKKLGVDVENDFAPSYEVISGKEKVVASLKRAANSADIIYLASDPDREGEAIAWHIQEQIKDKKKPIHRVQFNEITKQGIKDGIEHPGKVNINRVDAQQSRRILDRLVGYQISPLLWKTLKYGLSAGRVQSVALRMVCEREAEIEKFVTEESWSVDGIFDVFDGSKRKGSLKAALDKEIVGSKEVKVEFKSEADADLAIKSLDGAAFNITDVEKKSVKSSAPVPFVTARLQQEAIRKLGFTAKRAMAVAQQLYEGVNLGDGPSGLITYMRTDSTRIAPEAAEAAIKYVGAVYGKEFLPKSKRVAKTAKGAQDAHEAIRPTVIDRTPESVKQYLSPEQYKLYKLIWERFIASQMADALYEQTTVLIKGGKYIFRASGRVMVFAGYTTLYTESADEDAKAEDNSSLLNVSTNNSLN